MPIDNRHNKNNVPCLANLNMPIIDDSESRHIVTIMPIINEASRANLY